MRAIGRRVRLFQEEIYGSVTRMTFFYTFFISSFTGVCKMQPVEVHCYNVTHVQAGPVKVPFRLNRIIQKNYWVRLQIYWGIPKTSFVPGSMQ